MVSHTEFPALLDQIMAGKVTAPNLEVLDLSKGVAAIAAGGGLKTIPDIRNLKFAGSKSSWGHWARYFLVATQGGQLDGSGYVMWWDNSNGFVGRFAICNHKKVVGAGANPTRGWHPGKCSECGLDMTVDSSD